MQENRKEISLIKRNILKYAEYKSISKYEIYQKTGISRSVLSQNNGMTEDNLLKFLAYYSDVSFEWLLTGQGEMLKSKSTKKNSLPPEQTSQTVVSEDKDNNNPETVKEKDRKNFNIPDSRPETDIYSIILERNEKLARENALLGAENEQLKRQIEDLKDCDVPAISVPFSDTSLMPVKTVKKNV
jgi:hypothetical protein